MKTTIISTRGALVAGAVAGLLGCAGNRAAVRSDAPAATSAAVQCAGINSCRAQGSCAGNENACRAMNDCRGKGWVELPSAKECQDKGGTILEKKS
jgi:hypothetical protein